MSPSEAKRRVAQAIDLGPRHSVTGESLPPLLPAVAAAVRAGEISGEHAAVIIGCIERDPGRHRAPGRTDR